MEKIKELSAEERMNYLRSKSAEKQHPLQGLIDNGTLTQEQAEQICPVQKTGCKMKNPRTQRLPEKSGPVWQQRLAGTAPQPHQSAVPAASCASPGLAQYFAHLPAVGC